jgi:HEAT repeat protein
LHIRNSRIKEGLVYALLGIDHVNAIETLIVLSSDESSHIRNWATFGLGTLNEKNNIYIREALWNRVNDKNQDTKLEAIVGLARRKDKRINDIIKRELISGEYGTLIFEAIIEIQGLEFLPILKKILSNNSNDKTSNNLWVKELMNCIQELSKLTF